MEKQNNGKLVKGFSGNYIYQSKNKLTYELSIGDLMGTKGVSNDVCFIMFNEHEQVQDFREGDKLYRELVDNTIYFDPFVGYVYEATLFESAILDNDIEYIEEFIENVMILVDQWEKENGEAVYIVKHFRE